MEVQSVGDTEIYVHGRNGKLLYVFNPISNVQLHISRELAILELLVRMTENRLRSCQRITAKAINDANILWGQSGFET